MLGTFSVSLIKERLSQISVRTSTGHQRDLADKLVRGPVLGGSVLWARAKLALLTRRLLMLCGTERFLCGHGVLRGASKDLMVVAGIKPRLAPLQDPTTKCLGQRRTESAAGVLGPPPPVHPQLRDVGRLTPVRFAGRELSLEALGDVHGELWFGSGVEPEVRLGNSYPGAAHREVIRMWLAGPRSVGIEGQDKVRLMHVDELPALACEDISFRK